MNKITSALLFLIANGCAQSSMRRRMVLFYADVAEIPVRESQSVEQSVVEIRNAERYKVGTRFHKSLLVSCLR